MSEAETECCIYQLRNTKCWWQITEVRKGRFQRSRGSIGCCPNLNFTLCETTHFCCFKPPNCYRNHKPVPQMAKHRIAIWPWYIQGKSKISSYKKLHTSINSNIIHKSQKAEMYQSTDKWIQDVNLFNEILLSNEKEWSIDTYYPHG
jgi:hypothetical protein